MKRLQFIIPTVLLLLLTIQTVRLSNIKKELFKSLTLVDSLRQENKAYYNFDYLEVVPIQRNYQTLRLGDTSYADIVLTGGKVDNDRVPFITLTNENNNIDTILAPNLKGQLKIKTTKIGKTTINGTLHIPQGNKDISFDFGYWFDVEK